MFQIRSMGSLGLASQPSCWRGMMASLVGFAVLLMMMTSIGEHGLAQAQPMAQPASSHCVTIEGECPKIKLGGLIDCASACAALHSSAPLLASQPNLPRMALSPAPVVTLNGLSPEARSRPPRRIQII